jgi:site-specific recombinase XerD
MITLQTAKNKFQEFLTIEKQYSENTIKSYMLNLAQLSAFLKIKKITNLVDVNVLILKKFLVHLKEQNLSARSRSSKISTLKSFFGYCSKTYGINDIASCLIYPKLETKLPIVLSKSQIEYIILASEKQQTPIGKRNSIMLKILYATGLRASEIADLALVDIKFDQRVILIHGKGSKERLVPIPKAIFNDLNNYIIDVLPYLAKYKKVKYLFFNTTNKKMYRSDIYSIIKSIGNLSDIKIAMYPHMLRHSLATHLLQNGVSLRHIQKLLGHENLSTTSIYTHLNTTQLKNNYDEYHPRR